jgi:CheY-like chemotaxis protein
MVGNLLHNAGKFTPTGGSVTVHVTHDAQASVAVITIVDTGTGFEMADATRLFEPFSQAPSEDRKGGLGLGLALAKGLVHLHGGTVTASSPGLSKGATFTLSIPIAKDFGSQTHNRGLEASKAAFRPLSILVIEDHIDAGKSLQMLLSRLGHAVQVAPDGATGIAAAKEIRPDVVISDLGLPGIVDGYAVAEALRKDPSLGHVYLIALSGFGRTEDQQRTRQAGFDKHLVKPVDLLALQNTLAEKASKSQ